MLREYCATLQAIRAAAAGDRAACESDDEQSEEGDDLGAAAPPSGAQGLVMLAEPDQPRVSALQTASWIDLAAPPSVLLTLSADDPRIRNASLEYYQRPPNSLDEEALDELMRVWRTLSLSRHFMLIYELLTGQVRLKIDRQDSGASLGALLVRSLPLSDWHDGGAPLVSLLLLMTRQREALKALHAPGSAFNVTVDRGIVGKPGASKPVSSAQGFFGGVGGGGGAESPLSDGLPKYADLARQKELEEASGQKLKRALQAMVMGDEIARILVSRAHEVLSASRGLLLVEADELFDPWVVGDALDEPVRVPLEACERLLLSPFVANHDCAERMLSAANLSTAGEAGGGVNGGGAGPGAGGSSGPASERELGIGPLGVGVQFLSGMSTQPLKPLNLSSQVTEMEEHAPPSFSPQSCPAEVM